MAMTYEYSVDVNCDLEDAFALVDDLPQTPKWLKPCVALQKLSAGPNSVGDKLKYTYKQGGNQGEMAGEIVARKPNERLTCRYVDKMFEVLVDFKLARGSSGSRLTHEISMTPKTFFGKLMSPLIRIGLKKQTKDAMHALKSMLEAK